MLQGIALLHSSRSCRHDFDSLLVGIKGTHMENQYFNESLQNFVRDFAYGGAIRHLADLGYDTDRIIKEYHYPLPRDVIDKMVQDHLKSKSSPAADK